MPCGDQPGERAYSFAWSIVDVDFVVPEDAKSKSKLQVE
jgi:hypothetical protein